MHPNHHAGQRDAVAPSSATPQIIIPPSQLLRADSSADYYRNIGLLHTRRTDNSTIPGTGTLITVGGKYGVLTCAHAVYDPDSATHAPRYTIFMPGLTPGRTSSAIALEPGAFRISPGYQGIEAGPDDLAVIRLTDEQIPANSGPFATVETLPVNELAMVEVPGYPTQPPTAGAATPALYYGRGAGYQVEGGGAFLRYKASTLRGMSGSGVVRLDTRDQRQQPRLGAITAVHVGGSPAERPQDAYNYAVYLTEAKVQWIAAQLR